MGRYMEITVFINWVAQPSLMAARYVMWMEAYVQVQRNKFYLVNDYRLRNVTHFCLADSMVACCFYRAMHFSAKRGLAIACRPSVCPSISDVGGLWSHRLKILELIAQTISPTPSLSVAKRRSTYSQGNMGKFWGDYRWGREKVAC